MEKKKELKIKFHPDVHKDLAEATTEQKLELAEALNKMSSEDFIANSEPVDLEEMKREEPELYKKVMERAKSIR